MEKYLQVKNLSKSSALSFSLKTTDGWNLIIKTKRNLGFWNKLANNINTQNTQNTQIRPSMRGGAPEDNTNQDITTLSRREKINNKLMRQFPNTFTNDYKAIQSTNDDTIRNDIEIFNKNLVLIENNNNRYILTIYYNY